jgi:radical SAM-linked protein
MTATGHQPAGTEGIRARLRIRFSKVGKIRWTSHRDVARMWERAFRRVQLPLAYSEGFSPRPKVSFGLALPTGHESVAEFLDVEVTDLEGVDVPTLGTRLSAALPVGVDATAVAVLEPGTPSLQEDVVSCSWRWQIVPAEGRGPITAAQMADWVAATLAAPELVISRTRKGATVIEDVRPGIEELHLAEPEGVGPEDGEGGLWLEADLAVTPRTVRPAEVLTALAPDLEERHVRRTHQWILRDGARLEPLLEAARTGDATVAPHALERAS